ncbi:MAG: hypothetical protein H6740_29490 [Alphaproteobacteria bacterium]|nr:hypothetical protein [Alphaproteobacteria bacterium]
MSVTVTDHVADLSALGGWVTTSLSIANADEAVKLVFPRCVGGGQASLQFRSNDGGVAYAGTAGDDLGEDQHAQSAEVLVEWRLPLPADFEVKPALWVQVATAPTTLVVSLVPSGGGCR